MGTNYYIQAPAPFSARLHIGKSSGGWCFGLHVYPELGINTLDDWRPLFEKYLIVDEYDDVVSAEEMVHAITERSSHRALDYDWSYYSRNHAEPGPNNLLRHCVDGRFCIGHGEGTWDLMVGEFS